MFATKHSKTKIFHYDFISTFIELGLVDLLQHRLRVFENRVLRRIFGPKRDEVIGGWRKLHNEDLHNLYCSPSYN
jgi:hypothetical protein